jgi:N-acetyl-1-D-myo-inositol-2-amino-2-deoxy-alpha-D-glucopyranoside deacetylase
VPRRTVAPVPTVLAVIPHPDDESYSFGGTLALLARDGWRCLVACASSGEKGKRHDGGPTDPAAVAVVRQAELAASCHLLGLEAPRFWSLPDGGLKKVESQAGRLAALFDELRPDLVLSLGADGAYGHPDHIAVFHWLSEAVEAAARPPTWLMASFPRALFLPQYERCIGMMGDPPDPPPGAIGDAGSALCVDIRAVREVKLAAIAAHRSQLPAGDPHAIFPAGIVDRLLEEERFAIGYSREGSELAAPFTRKSRAV